MLWRKILSLSNLSLFESENVFSRKIISEKKIYIIVTDLWPAIFTSFVVQWSAKIAGRRAQLKPLINKALIMWSDNFNFQLYLSHYFLWKKIPHFQK